MLAVGGWTPLGARNIFGRWLHELLMLPQDDDRMLRVMSDADVIVRLCESRWTERKEVIMDNARRTWRRWRRVVCVDG